MPVTLADIQSMRGPAAAAQHSMTSRVHQVLRDAITFGALPPGTRLREVDIGRQFGFSPTPVREAFRILTQEGLIDYAPYKGHTVTDLTPGQIDNLYDIHEVLECHAVALAAARGLDDRAPFDDVLAREAETIAGPTQHLFNACDLEFHGLLNAGSGNIELARMIEQIHRRLQSARIAFLIEDPDRPHRSHDQHEQILAAVAANDVDRAVALTKAHIRANRSNVIRKLDFSSDESPG